MKNNKIRILVLLISILIILAQSCKTQNLTFPIDSDKFTEQYKKHKFRSNRWYKDKEIEIKGKISQVYKNEIILFIESSNNTLGISCKLKNNDIKKPFKQNQTVHIIGICKGIKENIIINDCIVLKKYNNK